jgi:pimeloyl-ACP methyl ester carboxylesterase
LFYPFFSSQPVIHHYDTHKQHTKHFFPIFQTGPTIDLAAKLCIQKVPLAGVILQSPLESAGRCVLGEQASYVLYYLDIFRSYEKIAQLAPIPVSIMHGLQDQVVPVTNGQALYQSLTKAQQIYQPDNDHHHHYQHTSNTRRGSRNSSDNHYQSVAYPPMWIPNVGHNDMPEFDCMQNIANFFEFLRKRQSST